MLLSLPLALVGGWGKDCCEDTLSDQQDNMKLMEAANRHTYRPCRANTKLAAVLEA